MNTFRSIDIHKTFLFVGPVVPNDDDGNTKYIYFWKSWIFIGKWWLQILFCKEFGFVVWWWYPVTSGIFGTARVCKSLKISDLWISRVMSLCVIWWCAFDCRLYIIYVWFLSVIWICLKYVFLIILWVELSICGLVPVLPVLLVVQVDCCKRNLVYKSFCKIIALSPVVQYINV